MGRHKSINICCTLLHQVLTSYADYKQGYRFILIYIVDRKSQLKLAGMW